MISADSKKWLAEIYESYADMVYRIAFLMLGNVQEAEDTVQNVFMRLLKQNRSFESKEHLKAWLIITSKNAARDVLKSVWRKRMSALDDHENLTYANTEKSEIFRQVMGLEAKYRVPLYLYYFEGYKSDEIAKMLGINHSTLRSRMRRARQELRLAIEEGLDE